MSKSILTNRPHLIPSLLVVAMLLLALADLPYGYYQLLRFVVCGVAVYIAYMAYTWQKMWAVWLFAFIAILFNPLVPIHFSRELWQVLDFICAILFIVSLFVVHLPTNNKLHKSS
ncbi:MAG: hypothetical protein NTW93_06615 [Phycisphaerae bacterium]|nr:hypothetical protein [Phycisphaerae bacterium]